MLLLFSFQSLRLLPDASLVSFLLGGDSGCLVFKYLASVQKRKKKKQKNIFFGQ